jgi:hypothetical protein
MLVRLAQRAYQDKTPEQFRSWLRGFAMPAKNSELLRWKFNKMLKEKLSCEK